MAKCYAFHFIMSIIKNKTYPPWEFIIHGWRAIAVAEFLIFVDISEGKGTQVWLSFDINHLNPTVWLVEAVNVIDQPAQTSIKGGINAKKR